MSNSLNNNQEDYFLIDLVDMYIGKPFKTLINIPFGNLIIPKGTTGEIVSIGEENCFGVVFDINVDDDEFWMIKRNKFKETILKYFFKNKILENEVYYHKDGRKIFLIEMNKFHTIQGQIKVY